MRAPGTTFYWDFADGERDSENISPQHTYSQWGDYDVTLHIETEAGCASEIVHTVTVDKDLEFPNVNDSILGLYYFYYGRTYQRLAVYVNDSINAKRYNNLLKTMLNNSEAKLPEQYKTRSFTISRSRMAAGPSDTAGSPATRSSTSRKTRWRVPR